jgi:cobalamin biosynthesis protein CobD/CbiB
MMNLDAIVIYPGKYGVVKSCYITTMGMAPRRYGKKVNYIPERLGLVSYTWTILIAANGKIKDALFDNPGRRFECKNLRGSLL